MPESSHEFLHIRVSEQSIYIPIDFIHSVLSLPALQVVPDQHPAFCGIVNFHGKGVGIYNLQGLLLNETSFELGIDSPLILTTVEDQLLGFVATDVLGMVSVQNELCQKPMASNQAFVSALVESESGTGWVIDLNRMILDNKLNFQHEVGHE